MNVQEHTEPAGHTMACGAGVGDWPGIVTPRGAGSIPVTRPNSTPHGAMVYLVNTGVCRTPAAGSSPASPAHQIALDTKAELFA